MMGLKTKTPEAVVNAAVDFREPKTEQNKDIKVTLCNIMQNYYKS